MPEQQHFFDQEPGQVLVYLSEQETASFCRLEVEVIRSLTEAGVVSGIEVAGEAQRRYGADDLVLLAPGAAPLPGFGRQPGGHRDYSAAGGAD